MKNKSCSVFGLGYIGLPTATLISMNGYKVFGIEVNQKIIRKLQKGKIHIKEPGLEKIFNESLTKKYIEIRSNPIISDVFVITVPTPFKPKKDKLPTPDLSFVFSAVTSICKVLKEKDLIILESTSPVGTTKKIEKLIRKLTGFNNKQINLAYCPERVIPGNTIKELIYNDRVVGGLTQEATIMATEFYASFCKGEILQTNSDTAELVKLSENAYRDVNIAFANELSIIADKAKINIREVIKLSNHHPRVNILQPGCGVGGHCIAVDPWFIISEEPENTKLIKTARNVNDYKSEWVFNKIFSIAKSFHEKNGIKPLLGILGLTFKPNIDDIRQSPALAITKRIIQSEYDLIVAEPNLKECEDINLYKIDEVLKNSQLIFSLVAHDEFKGLNFEDKNHFDFCGLID